MSIKDLDLILKKDPIISTWPARSLCEKPRDVEKDYLVHARTHLPLGDTARYVETALKWVSGVNKGAFIGAVLGDYGEGKTSFLVHMWAESREQRVCAVPPFEWSAFEEIVDATSGWIQYLLRDTRPDLARRMRHVYDSFRQQTVEQLARATAETTSQDYQFVLETVLSLVDSGTMQLTEMSAARLLDLVAAASDIVRQAGYKGLLILVDEPEVAAKKLGSEAVQHFLFDLSNELHRRQGDYGVFLSMPGNFFASAQARFSALPARLEVRGCFPRLGDIHGADFAEVLWSRYVEEFALGDEGRNLVSPLALQAIGQVGSSDHRLLSYGPRSVVSTFSRMVDHYQQTGEAYSPQHFVQDVLDQEILVKPDYRSRILSVQRSPDVNDDNREPLMLLAGFPSGLHHDKLRELGIEEILRPLARSGGLVYRTAFTMGLRALRRLGEEGQPASLLSEMIEEIDAEYAPDRRAFQNALKAFAQDVVPLIFSERKGQQLVGWQTLHPLQEVAPGVYLGAKQGAFPYTVRRFPNRVVMVLVNDQTASLERVRMPDLDDGSGLLTHDLLFQFQLQWHPDQMMPAELVHLGEDPDNVKPARICLCLDLHRGTITQEHLAELVGADRLTTLWVLNLLQRMRDVEQLPRESEVEWTALKDIMLRQVLGLLLNQELDKAMVYAAEEKLGERLATSGMALLGSVSNVLLARRYPDYETLIRQPHWKSRADDYINALTSSEIPLACKRGRESWRADADLAARVLGTSRMNLTGGAFDGFESLIEIESKSRQAPLEVAFHVHPLEDGIRELITSQPMGADRKLKREGKECWYAPIVDLLPVILGKGYTVDELQKIVEMGKARQSFDETQRRGERVLYCKPIDPEELKAQLRAKLTDLQTEVNEYKQLPDYVTSFDSLLMEQAIDSVEDDADYDRLMTRMNKEFEQNHSRLPGYFARVEEKMRQLRNRVKTFSDRVLGSREVAQLALPSAKSPWGAALGRYIVPNLERAVDALRKDSKTLLETIDGSIMRFSFSRQRIPQDNLILLREAWSHANDIESLAGDLSVAAQTLLQQLSEFNEWNSLVRHSDQAYGRLLELQRDPEHQAKARELITTFDDISQAITDHLELRNVMGLSAHRQFLKRFEDLDRERQRYLTSLKSNFDRCKGRINEFLDALNLDARVRVVFNPLDVAACYEQLFSEGTSLISEHALARALVEIVTQERELMYARDILTVIESAAAPLLTGLKETSQAVRALEDEIDTDWLRHVIENDDQAQVQRLEQVVSSAFAAVRKTQRAVRQVTLPTEPKGGRVRAMYEMIPEHQDIDLEELVLQMMGQMTDPSQVLDASLKSLADLFRRNCIQVRVGRRHR